MIGVNREQRERNFSTGKHYVGSDDRRPTKAIPGYTGHLQNSKDLFGMSSGKILEKDYHHENQSVSIRSPKSAAGSTFLSALETDGAVWDHQYLTTSRAMEGIPAKQFAATTAPSIPNLVGYTGHIHMSQDVLGAPHEEVVRFSLSAIDDQKNKPKPMTEESRPHWTTYCSQSKGDKSWKQQYALNLSTRPNPRMTAPTPQQLEAMERAKLANLTKSVDRAADIINFDSKRALEENQSGTLRSKFIELKAQSSKQDATIDMGPSSMELKDNTMNLAAPEEEASYTGHFSSSLQSRRTIGYTGHMPGSLDSIGMNFGRMERRANPFQHGDYKHPLGHRYQNSVQPYVAVIDKQVKALVQKPSRPRKSNNPIVDSFRMKIVQRGGRIGFRSLSNIFRNADTNNSNTLNRYELQSCLHSFGIHPSQLEMDQLMVIFDRDGSGQITLNEMITALRGDLNIKRVELVLQAYELIEARCNGNVAAQDLINLFDASYHPEVLAGEKTIKQVTAEFVDGWNKIGTDRNIPYEEFADYYADISAGIDDDNYFELMIRNVWHVSGGEGPAANISCRRVLVLHEDGSETIEVVQNDLGVGPDDKIAILDLLKRQGVSGIKAIKIT